MFLAKAPVGIVTKIYVIYTLYEPLYMLLLTVRSCLCLKTLIYIGNFLYEKFFINVEDTIFLML